MPHFLLPKRTGIIRFRRGALPTVAVVFGKSPTTCYVPNQLLQVPRTPISTESGSHSEKNSEQRRLSKTCSNNKHWLSFHRPWGTLVTALQGTWRYGDHGQASPMLWRCTLSICLILLGKWLWWSSRFPCSSWFCTLPITGQEAASYVAG